ncbi:heterokaryon incompatibility protein-domain-containing protein [Xylaria sp. FL1042]|nr:heterokaryon incompatibility protein-domain-containing protein [Xylaria sp. FL1042]
MSFLVPVIVWAIVPVLIRLALRPPLDNKKRLDLIIYLVALRWTYWSGAEIRPLTFWILSALIWWRGPSTLNTVLWGLHLVLGTHIGSDGIHFPGLTLNPKWSAFIIYGWMFLGVSLYCGPIGVVATAATVFNLCHFMYPFNEHFDLTWVFAWWLLYTACLFAMAPGMSLYWYGMWYGIMGATALCIRPDQSKPRFISWATAILLLRPLIYTLYASWLARDLIYPAFFSSNYFVNKWRVSSSVWYPLSSRDPGLQDHSYLCERCDRITRKSNLIMGSSSYFTKLVEWHSYWSKKELCSRFEDGISINQSNITSCGSNAKHCGLCSLIWHSMSLKRRENVVASMNISDGVVKPPISDLPLPTNTNDELRVKVWEERPLSPHTYAQLYWGEVAIGARLLIHRENLFPDPSQAVDQARTNSVEHFQQAKEWIRLCRENHTLCNSTNNRDLELPARFLYVSAGREWQPGDRPAILKLVPTIDLEKRPEYVAFSHCWGPPETIRFKLLENNIEQCYKEIDFTRLSQNMQDAITATLSLGNFSYIWIDSLCIIQKDERDLNGDGAWKRDWEIEAKKMGGVYSGAALTIASTGSSSSDGGCFHTRKTQSLRPIKIGVSSRTSSDADWIFARQDDIFDFERNVNLAPLNTRGWVTQERLLSRRVLHFGAEMIYWECCGRSASEFNHHGYRYKSYPEDFADWYTPDLGNMETREDVEKGEREGRGFSWASSESIRRRPPPPVMVDPDNDASFLSTQAKMWQRRRVVWKDVLKRADESWSQDEKTKEQGRGDRAGFRAIFETLRFEEQRDQNPYTWAMQNGPGVKKEDSGQKRPLVGRHSFSQMWYDIVESYSRGKLTVPTDKLIALKGIQDEIAYATGFTYMYGLWRESLVTDMLWFAIEGPGRRLQTVQGASVAPTWSWASIDAPVALDLLLENSRVTIKLKQQLVRISNVHVSGDTYPTLSASQQGETSIELRGWMFPISRPPLDAEFNVDVWEIGIDRAKTIFAKVFFDTDTQDILVESSFVCVPFLILERQKPGSFMRSVGDDIQGLVLRLDRISDGYKSLDVYERVGYFTTSYLPKSQDVSQVQAALKAHEEKTFCLTG